MSGSDNKKLMPSLLDREISSSTSDSFGHSHFAKALESLVEAPSNVPPFSIGLLGKWGTGKSSIKTLYLASLADDIARGNKGLRRSERIKAVTFNAWRFGGENIKRALLRHVFLSLGGAEDVITDSLFNQVQKPTKVPKTWREILAEIYDKWPWALLQMSIVLAFALIFIHMASYAKDTLGLSQDWPTVAVLGAFALFFGLTAKYLLDPKRFFISRYGSITRVELPSASSEQYEDHLIRQLEAFKGGKVKDYDGAKCERIIVFVDDLDRLSAEEMVSGLDAVRTFMEISTDRLPEGLGIVFVISCDEDRVADALADRRKQRSSPDLPGAVFTRNDARRYLDRIFQFRLEIPPFPKQDMRSYARKLLTKNLPEVVEAVSKQTSLDEVVNRLIHVSVQSPRNALQILNAFVQSWWLAQERERSGAGTDSPGGLQEGAVTKYPLALAAISVLRVDFPDFYDDLLHEPELVKRFTDVYARNQPLEEQPEITRLLLQKYFDKDTNSLRSVYRPLRQYLSSLIGIQWPSTLQPLLLLSQDPVSRKMGDRGRRVYESMVSGDAAGLLTNLGREKDTKPLSNDEMYLLRNINEDLESETTDIRNNAAATLALIADRMPQSDAHLLMVPLSRQLADAPQLRWRLGLPIIDRVLRYTTADDRKLVIGMLIGELMPANGEEISFRLESGETPSLREAVDIVREAGAMALNIRDNDGLNETHDRQLLEWLLVRHIAIGGQSQDLPFTQLEDWMTQHESGLLSGLSSRYADALAAQLESVSPPSLDPDIIVRRLRTILNSLWERGEESRPELWRLLARFASVRMKEAVTLTWEMMGEHLESPDPTLLSDFVQKLSERLERDMTAGEAWKITDWENGGNSLLHITSIRKQELNISARKALASLASQWGTDAATGSLAVRLLDELQSIPAEEAKGIATAWIAQIEGLADQCLVWLGTHYVDLLTDEQRTELTNDFRIFVQPAIVDISEEHSAKLKVLLSSLPENAFSDATMVTFLDNLYRQVTDRSSNDAYLRRAFPAIPETIADGPKTIMGTMLHTLFANTRSIPALHGFLHQKMLGHWPGAASNLAPYTPDQIFAWANAFIQQYPNEQSAPSVLATMQELVSQNLVTTDGGAELVNAAVSLWQFYKAEALETLVSAGKTPSPALIAKMTESTDVASTSDTDYLTEAWDNLAVRLPEGQLTEVAKQLLAVPVSVTADAPDRYLKLWAEAAGVARLPMLEELLRDEGINDDQKTRVWLQIEAMGTALSTTSLLNLLPDALIDPEAPQTARNVLDSQQDISERFQTPEERIELGHALLNIFRDAPSQETKNRLAAWLKSLDNEAILKEVNSSGIVNENDLDILRQQFPKSRYLKKRD